MPRPLALTTWASRDLMTISSLLMNIQADSTDLTNDPNITRQTRESASSIRADARAAKILLDGILSRNDDLLFDNGPQEPQTEAPR